MIRIKNTIKSFIDRGGHFVFSSMMVSKVLNFILSLLIVHILTKETYGNISYALSIIMIILPFSGFGLHHAMLRFGSTEKTVEAKNNMFVSFLKWGLLFSLIIIIVLFLLSDFITIRLPGSKQFLHLLTPMVIAYFGAEMIFALFRVQKNNVLFSWGVILRAILVLGLCSVFSIIFGGTGYALTYALIPLLVMLIMLIPGNRKYGISQTKRYSLDLKPYVKYGLWVGIGSIASQLVILLDTIMVGNIIADSSRLALYKVATIIPANLLFIPSILLKTDFVYIAENYKKRSFLIKYYKKYLFIFVVITVAMFAVWFIFSDLIMKMFGSQYIDAKPIITILLFMVAMAFLTRIPLGNILNALGKSPWNTYSNLILLAINVALNALMIPKYGLNGAAYATCISVGISGMINIGLFILYLNKYCDDPDKLSKNNS